MARHRSVLRAVRVPLRLAAAASFIAVVALPAPALRAANDDPGARVSRVERWLRAASQHVPGTDDAWTREISAWSLEELSTFRVDARVLLSLIRNPRL